MNQPTNTMFPRTIGMDLGSKKTAYCIVSPNSERLEESELGTDKKSMRAFFSSQSASRVVVELARRADGSRSWQQPTGTRSSWRIRANSS